MIRIRNGFMVVWGIDSNLRTLFPCYMDRDIFINSGTDDLAPMFLIKVGDVGSAPTKLIRIGVREIIISSS